MPPTEPPWVVSPRSSATNPARSSHAIRLLATAHGMEVIRDRLTRLALIIVSTMSLERCRDTACTVNPRIGPPERRIEGFNKVYDAVVQERARRCAISSLLGKHCLRKLRNNSGDSSPALVPDCLGGTPSHIQSWEKLGRALAGDWPHTKIVPMMIHANDRSLTGPMYVKLHVKLDTLRTKAGPQERHMHGGPRFAKLTRTIPRRGPQDPRITRNRKSYTLPEPTLQRGWRVRVRWERRGIEGSLKRC
jgi:hypothetical protein